MTKPLLIFDLDGTLVEFPREYIFTQTKRILSEFAHPPVSLEAMLHHFSNFDFFRFVEDPDRESFIARYWKTFDWANYPQPVPLEGALDTLAELKLRGHRIALATARIDPIETLTAALEPTGLLDYLEHLETRPGEHVEWTDKTGHIANVCSKFGVKPEDVVFVGDIPADVKSAKAAGVGRSVAVLSGGIYRSVLEVEQPDFLVDDVRALLTLAL